jgi:hypothetical protein
MNHDDAWRESIRASLRAPAEDEDAPTAALARTAIERGKRRLVARSSTRVAMLGVVFAVGALIWARQWAEAEATQTAESTLRYGAPWTP